MNDEAPRKKSDDGGGGGWITTFADLMSLLMCFFVLLLSFAELDVMKFKAIAGSMKLAFGVQREIRAIEVPKGTSIIAQEFSSGKPDPTVLKEIRQQTIDEDKQSLEFTDALVEEKDGTEADEQAGSAGAGAGAEEIQAEADAERLKAALRNEIEKGMIEIETEGATIVVRIREKGSFPSGVARFDPTFKPVIAKLRDSLQDMNGKIVVAGHTDDVPIRTSLYRSNWDLSSARAVSVVHALLDAGELDPARMVVEGHGEAHPLVPNDSREHRARNRRVEITIRQTADGKQGEREQLAAYGDAIPASDAPAEAVEQPGGIPDVPDVPGIPGIPGFETANEVDPAAAQEPTSVIPIPATVVPPPGSEPPPIAVFPERPADAPKSRLDLIRDGVRTR